MQDLGKYSAGRETSYIIFFAWNVTQSVWRAVSEMKGSDTPWSDNTPTCKLITEAYTLMIERLVFP